MSDTTNSRLVDRLTAPFWIIRTWWVRQRIYSLVRQIERRQGKR